MKRPEILKTAIKTQEISSKWILCVEIPHSVLCAEHKDLNYDPYEEVGFNELFILGDKHWEKWTPETQTTFNGIWEALSKGWEEGKSLEVSEKIFPIKDLLQAFIDALKNEKLKIGDEDAFWRSRAIVKLIQDHRLCNENVRLLVIWGW